MASNTDTYEVLTNTSSIPFAIELSLEEAEELDIALNVLEKLSAPTSQASGDSQIRRNPSSPSLQSLRTTLANMLGGEYPKTKKEAAKIAKQIFPKTELGKVMPQINDIFSQIETQVVTTFCENVAQSLAKEFREKYREFVNKGHIAQIVASRWGRFKSDIDIDSVDRIRFDDLSDSNQTFIMTLLLGTSALLNIQSEDELSEFPITKYCEALTLFPNETALTKIMTVLGKGELRPDFEFIGGHYAPAFIHTLNVATELDPKLTWCSSSIQSSAYDIVSNTSTILTQNELKSICQEIQSQMTTASLKVTLSILAKKQDSTKQMRNEKVQAVFQSFDYISSPEELDSFTPVAIIMYFTQILTKDITVFESLLASNIVSVPTTKKAIDIIVSKLRVPAGAQPILAYEYATLSTVNERSYFDWAFDLIQAFVEAKITSMNSNFAKGIVSRTRALRDENFELFELEIPKLIEVLSKIPNVVDIKNHPFNDDFDTQKFSYIKNIGTGNVGGESTQKASFTKKALDAVNKANLTTALEAIFGTSNEVDIKDPIQAIFIMASKFVNNTVSKKMAFTKIADPHVENCEVYLTSKYNPLNLVLGLEGFWNCCLTALREANSATLSAFFDDAYAFVTSFLFNYPGVKAPQGVSCGALTSLVKTESILVGPDSKPIQDLLSFPKDLSLHIGSSQISLIYKDANSNTNSIALHNDTKSKIVGYTFGGIEVTKTSFIGLSDESKAYAAHAKKALGVAVSSTPFLLNVCVGAPDSGGKNEELSNGFSENLFFTKDLDKNLGVQIQKEKLYTEAYAEITREVSAANAIFGIQTIINASAFANALHIYFDAFEDDEFDLVYVTKSGDQKSITLQGENARSYLQYMFSFPKGEHFIPFRGEVHFHTPLQNQSLCKELLIPSWFNNPKPLVRNDVELYTRDLIAMRTPRAGAFIHANGRQSRIL